MAQRTLNRRSRDRDEEQYDDRGSKDDHGTHDEDDAPPPRRSRGRSRSEEPEQDEAPRGRRSRRDDDEGERAPRSSRRSSSDDDDEPRVRATSKGWGGFKEKRAETSDWVKNYKYPEAQEEIIKILDGEPFSIFAEHWLDEKKGKKSYTCIGKTDCPLCAIGDKPKVYSLFNVLDLRDGEEPKVFPWKVSQTTTDVLEGFATSERTSPIDRVDVYFSVRKTGGGQKGKVQINLNPVKARDLQEDWGIEPYSAAELAEFDLYEEDDVVEFTSRKTLKAIADDLDD